MANKKILFVDGNTQILESLATRFKTREFDVIAPSNLKDVLETADICDAYIVKDRPSES
ncbi:MAG: DNA-binding response OmpR family regulator [Candidatus Omnitrophota bacterium]|jgi:DNA-binding response OmpR family regulator